MNPDRHAGDILLQTIDDMHSKAWGIDHDQALIGWPGDFAAAAATGALPSTRNIARGLPLDLLAAGALAAAEQAALIPYSLLEEFVDESCGITGERDPQTLLAALVTRMGSATTLTTQYLVALRDSQ
jgi:hypothetical protein